MLEFPIVNGTIHYKDGKPYGFFQCTSKETMLADAKKAFPDLPKGGMLSCTFGVIIHYDVPTSITLNLFGRDYKVENESLDLVGLPSKGVAVYASNGTRLGSIFDCEIPLGDLTAFKKIVEDFLINVI